MDNLILVKKRIETLLSLVVSYPTMNWRISMNYFSGCVYDIINIFKGLFEHGFDI